MASHDTSESSFSIRYGCSHRAVEYTISSINFNLKALSYCWPFYGFYVTGCNKSQAAGIQIFLMPKSNVLVYEWVTVWGLWDGHDRKLTHLRCDLLN